MKMFISFIFVIIIDDVSFGYWLQFSSDLIERKVYFMEIYILVSVEFIIIRNNDKFMWVL